MKECGDGEFSLSGGPGVFYRAGSPNDNSKVFSTSQDVQQKWVRQSPSVNTRRRSHISAGDFLKETTEEERRHLLQELSDSILYFIERDCAVYLEGFGLLIPRHATNEIVRTLGTKNILRTETKRLMTFEKCDELCAHHRERHNTIIETKELARRIHPRLPVMINVHWTPQDTRRYLRGFFKYLAHETVVQGHSRQLKAIGTFYSLHNRQGTTFSDWFAGADIFIKQSAQQILMVQPGKVFKQPVLTSAWEPLEAAYGPPKHVLRVDIREELLNLGYDPQSLREEDGFTSDILQIAVFDRSSESEGALLYCTDGLRKISSTRPTLESPGTEFTFQLSVSKSSDSIPRWPARPLTMGWILLQGSKSRSVKPGAGLCCDLPLADGMDTSLDAIITTPFCKLKGVVRSPQGPFRYTNIVGITSDEAEVAERLSPEYLLSLLEYKKLDQATVLSRSSLQTKRR